MKRYALLTLVPFLSTPVAAEALPCDLAAYRAQPGLAASAQEGDLVIEWEGANTTRLRIRFGLESGQPMLRELAVLKEGWRVLGRDLIPEFSVATGRRRISEQQLDPLRKLKVPITQELIDREKWNVFWDAPLSLPGLTGVNPDLPRRPEEIRRDSARFQVRSCTVRTNGARLEVSFPGVELGLFTGALQFTVYRGTNLIRQEMIASTQAPSVAYKYDGGLRGFPTQDTRVLWWDTSRSPQKYAFGGSPNQSSVALKARNRLVLLESPAGTLAVFPPPHKFFWAREVELNLGYVWYRKDNAGSFAAGVRQAEQEEPYPPYGFSDDLWERRVRQSRRFALGNFALYNAPPGTLQRMALYWYPDGAGAQEVREAVLRFTHGDTFRALPGYQTAVSHFHTHFHEQLADAGGLDYQPPWLPAFRALGINIAMMSDFHGDGHGEDSGELRFQDQKTYFEACRRHSDKGFLLMPGEEPNTYFGGHYTMIFPRPVFWTKVRAAGRSPVEQHPDFGRVYHVGSAQEELAMLEQEGGLVWQAHPRTKGSTGYPDAIRDTPHFRSDRYLGGAFQSLPADLSQSRICETRCLGTLDDMNNWGGPKYLVAEGDTYMKYPEYELYTGLFVNYVRLDRVPAFDEDWSPILEAMRRGDFFVSTGEVLFRNYRIIGNGPERRMIADLEWTFPLEFVELVWGDGRTVNRQIIPAADHPPFGRHRFEIPFPAAGKKWIRLAAWDSAGNGAFTQPVHLGVGPQ